MNTATSGRLFPLNMTPDMAKKFPGNTILPIDRGICHSMIYLPAESKQLLRLSLPYDRMKYHSACMPNAAARTAGKKADGTTEEL